MKIVVERGVTRELSELPEFSIALDGYVQGPAVDTKNHRISFDHHAGCIRMFTSATCKQVLDALLLGLDPTKYTLYVNDVDGDTALAVWLLQNSEHCTNKRVRELVEQVAAVDAHGPQYPTSNPALASRFYKEGLEALNAAYKSKTYGSCDLGFLLEKCVASISLLVFSVDGEAAPEPERAWSVVYASSSVVGQGWVLVESESYIFDLVYKAGHHVAVAYQKLPDGSFLYTIGKRSDLVDFPLGPHTDPSTVLSALNKLEPGWGGGSTIGGAPRNADGSRSKLTPQQIIVTIESFTL